MTTTSSFKTWTRQKQSKCEIYAYVDILSMFIAQIEDVLKMELFS